jgi:hypothetical protein
VSLRWQKIHLIGGPGSGKTSTGVALVHRFGLPHLDLDDIFWEREAPTYGPQTAPAVRDAALIEFHCPAGMDRGRRPRRAVVAAQL